MTTLKKRSEFIVPDKKAFKVFDPQQIPSAGTGAIFGARGTGKTVVMRSIIYDIRKKFKEVYVFSSTAKLYQYDGLDYDFVPRSNFYDGLDEEVLWSIWNDRYQETEKRRVAGLEIEDHWCLIFDDIVADGQVKFSKILNKIYMEGRHVGLFAVINTQHVTAIPPTVRRNLNFAVMFYPASDESREILTHEYMSLDHPRIGEAILRELTEEPYQTAVWLRNPAPRDYTDHIFTYKAPSGPNGGPLHKNFTIGSSTKKSSMLHITKGPKNIGLKKKGLTNITFFKSDQVMDVFLKQLKMK